MIHFGDEPLNHVDVFNKRKMGKPVILVTGASGNIGTATVAALAAKYADKVEIRAGVRNPDKADKLKAIVESVWCRPQWEIEKG